jgi:8-oxo-dGTP diphosphatase
MIDIMPDQPLIAIDVVPVAFSSTDGLLLGTAAREFAPFAGRQALPGVLLASGERLDEAAYRALQAKAGIVRLSVRHLMQLKTFDGPTRDPRSAAISVAYLAVVDPGAGAKTGWSTFTGEIAGLPFDHDVIVAEAKAQMAVSLWTNNKMTHALTGVRFNSANAARLIQDLSGRKPHAGNLHRLLSNHESIIRLEGNDVTGRGRPATAWRWGV